MINISILHEKINSILPIDGISPKSDGGFVVHYANSAEPSTNQLKEINSIIESWPLENMKIHKLNELDIFWQNTTDNGWTTPYGWKLGLTINDVTLLTGAFVLAKEASQLGLNNPVSIIDTEGLSHELSLQDLTMLMLQYGNARAQLSSKYANVKTQINDCVSLEQLDNFDIEIVFNNK